MKLLLLYVILGLSGGVAFADPVPLFDGTTLDGWDYDPAAPASWRVEDGAITGGGEWLAESYRIATASSYQNFDLTLDLRLSGNLKTGFINSGILIRSERIPPEGKDIAGYQADVGPGFFGRIYDQGRQNIYIFQPADQKALEEAIDSFGWNSYRIRAEGPRIQVWINDVPASDFTETNSNVALDGKVAFQLHFLGAPLVQARNVFIEELSPTVGAPTWDSLGGVEAALEIVPPGGFLDTIAVYLDVAVSVILGFLGLLK